MVFTSIVNFVRARGPDIFWRKRQVLRSSAVRYDFYHLSQIFTQYQLIFQHFYGRRRNCYKLALRGMHRAMQYSTINRDLKKQDLEELWTQRIESGIAQHGLSIYHFRDAMQKSNILLNRKILSELAAWEPATFEAIAKIGKDIVDKEQDELKQQKLQIPITKKW